MLRSALRDNGYVDSDRRRRFSLHFSGVIARAEANPISPHIPFSFVENRGQSDTSVRYIGTGPEFKAGGVSQIVGVHGRTAAKASQRSCGRLRRRRG
jgi:hypothetical protein